MTHAEATLPASRPPSIPRRRTIAGLAAGLLALLGSASRVPADEPRPAAPALARVRALTELQGDHVGYDFKEGEFYSLSRSLLAEGDERSWHDLLVEPSPIARAMGLYLLTQANGVGAVPILTASLGDRAPFDEYAGGCVGWPVSVGEFARQLIRNRRHLRYGVTPEPLVDAAGLRRIDLGILANDREANLHDHVGRDLAKEIEAGGLRLEWAALRREGGGLTDLALAKAVGRVPTPGAKDFLLATLADASAAPLARLAAASALTRLSMEGVTVALERARPDLDRAGCEPVTDRFLETLKAREAHEVRWAAWRAIPEAARSRRDDPRLVAAEFDDHPLAIDALRGPLDLLDYRYGKVREAIVDSLVRIANGLRPTAPWDAWGDAPYRLEMFAVPVWSYPRPGEVEYWGLKTAERARLMDALRPHLPAK